MPICEFGAVVMFFYFDKINHFNAWGVWCNG